MQFALTPPPPPHLTFIPVHVFSTSLLHTQITRICMCERERKRERGETERERERGRELHVCYVMLWCKPTCDHAHRFLSRFWWPTSFVRMECQDCCLHLARGTHSHLPLFHILLHVHTMYHTCTHMSITGIYILGSITDTGIGTVNNIIGTPDNTIACTYS